MKLTPSQCEAVAYRGSNLLVAASAGSGKTEVLARRCAALIADAGHPCEIDRLLVVTFTRAAAAELRVRVARMLREEADHATEPALRRHLQRQEVLVETADIGTIDAWCGRLVRAHFAQSGVDVGFTVLDEQEALLLRRRTLDQLFDWLYVNDGVVAAAARSWIARAAVPDARFLRELIERLSRFREHLVNPEDWLARQHAVCSDNMSAASAEQLLAAALGAECRFLRDQLALLLRQSPDEQAATVLGGLAENLVRWTQELASPGRLMDVVRQLTAFDLPRPGRRASESPVLTEVRERWLKRRLHRNWSEESVGPLLERAGAAAELLATLLYLEARYEQMLRAAKTERAAYEFGDVQRMALDLLGTPTAGPQRSPTDIARRLQQQYEHVLVDEYQDTSPTQVEVLRLVTRDGPGCSNRFMVGDVKQSIYGFRQAEPRLFSAFIADCAARQTDGRVQYLSDNFRSHAGVLTALNELFAGLFDAALGGTAFGAEERLRAGRPDIENPSLAGRPRVTVHVIEQSPDAASDLDDTADELNVERIEREAQLSADQIHALLDSGVQIPERQPDETLQLRPLRLADIVILLRSAKQNAGFVARVLRDRRIACVAVGREALLDVNEVGDVCAVLRLLANRRQDVPLAAYLRGPLVGLSAADLLQIRTACARPDADYYDAVEQFAATGPDATLRTAVQHALQRLDEWSAAARAEELPALLRQILDAGELRLFAQGLRDGAQRVLLLGALENLAARFAASGGHGVAEFVEYLDALSEQEIDAGALAPTDENVVRIMTIHGAKGLEFPVVFLLGTAARFNTRGQSAALQADEHTGIGVRFKDYTARAEVIGAAHHIGRLALAQRELEEELRLLYVATTRARELLLIIGTTAAGVWHNHRARWADSAGSPPLVSRLAVASRLEWVLMAVAAGRLSQAGIGGVPLVEVQTHAEKDIHLSSGAAENGRPTPRVEPAPAEARWVNRALALLAAPTDRAGARLPAVLSVSAAKELACREAADDVPHMLDRPQARLRTPAFATAPSTPDGREMGTACHRFLELADLTQLNTPETVQAEIGRLLASGALTAGEAALIPVAEVSWFATTPEGALLARSSGRVRRELPFVYALDPGVAGQRTVMRGVIDCVIEGDEGLVLYDYKTDRPHSAAELAARVAGYGVQMQLYALAAQAILRRPVERGILVFLREQQIVGVPVDADALAAAVQSILSVQPSCAGSMSRPIMEDTGRASA